MRRSRVFSMTLYPEDVAILDRLAVDLSLNRSAVIRMSLKALERLANNNQVEGVSLEVPHEE